MESGIYKISNTINKKIYIGSSKKLKKRFNAHRSALKNKYHNNPILQNHVNKYGINTLTFSIIEFCEPEFLIKKEQFYLDTIKPENNIHKIAQSPKGLKRTPEQIKRIVAGKLAKSGYRKGFFVSAETRKKISDSKKGQKRSEETKKQHSIFMKGRRMSEETKKKISKTSKGRIFSKETRDKISIKLKGNKNWATVNYSDTERNKKISQKISIPVYQLLNGVFIKEWDSAKIAGKTLGFNHKNISNCLTYKRKTAGGFQWKRK